MLLASLTKRDIPLLQSLFLAQLGSVDTTSDETDVKDVLVSKKEGMRYVVVLTLTVLLVMSW